MVTATLIRNAIKHLKCHMASADRRIHVPHCSDEGMKLFQDFGASPLDRNWKLFLPTETHSARVPGVRCGSRDSTCPTGAGVEVGVLILLEKGAQVRPLHSQGGARHSSTIYGILSWSLRLLGFAFVHEIVLAFTFHLETKSSRLSIVIETQNGVQLQCRISDVEWMRNKWNKKMTDWRSRFFKNPPKRILLVSWFCGETNLTQIFTNFMKIRQKMRPIAYTFINMYVNIWENAQNVVWWSGLVFVSWLRAGNFHAEYQIFPKKLS